LNRDKRERIIEAAVDLFQSSHQLRKVSVEEIAKRASVSPTTIYHYFGTRETLVEEIARRLVMEIIERTRKFLSSSLPFPQKLQEVISGKIALASQANDEIVNKMMSQDQGMAKFIEEVYRKELVPIWNDFLSDGKESGYIDPDLDADVFLTYLDILRAGFGAKADLLREWRKNLPLLQKMTRLVFYGFMKRDVDLFGAKLD